MTGYLTLNPDLPNGRQMLYRATAVVSVKILGNSQLCFYLEYGLKYFIPFRNCCSGEHCVLHPVKISNNKEIVKKRLLTFNILHGVSCTYIRTKPSCANSFRLHKVSIINRCVEIAQKNCWNHLAKKIKEIKLDRFLFIKLLVLQFSKKANYMGICSLKYLPFSWLFYSFDFLSDGRSNNMYCKKKIQETSDIAD